LSSRSAISAHISLVGTGTVSLPQITQEAEERRGEAMSASLGRLPCGAGQVVGKMMVHRRNLAGVGADMPEAERGALEVDGLHGVVTSVFQAGAGTIDPGELRHVTSGVEGVLAVAQ
jgi:hypothetical protein